jgi:hypothetical protein
MQKFQTTGKGISRMRTLLVLAALVAASVIPNVASATHYNQRFDCGNGWVVWVAVGRYGNEGEETREPQLIFEVSYSKYDFGKEPVVQTPRFLFDSDKEQLTANGKACK